MGWPPTQIDRYRVDRLLGQGGFGLVYLALDGQPQRPVVVKLPHRHRVTTAADAAAYLHEARAIAALDHPHIVPVYDVGGTADCPFFVVSKYVAGTDLATRLKRARLALADAAGLVATVAEALRQAHKQGGVHRDVKPGNLLLEAAGTPFVADFRLALREQDVGTGPRYAGTPAFMSPEQARCEGHRVDGRSDIFILGLVFYELLVGPRPFAANSQAELMAQVATLDPRPPRQYDEQIPKELGSSSASASGTITTSGTRRPATAPLCSSSGTRRQRTATGRARRRASRRTSGATCRTRRASTPTG